MQIVKKGGSVAGGPIRIGDILLGSHLAQVHTLVVLDRVEGLIHTQSSVVALLVDAVVDGLVHSDPTALDAVVHVLVALVQDSLAAAYAILDLTRPSALSTQQLLYLVVGRT